MQLFVVPDPVNQDWGCNLSGLQYFYGKDCSPCLLRLGEYWLAWYNASSNTRKDDSILLSFSSWL